MSVSTDVRIGTAEREQAAALLGEHFSAGRLDSEEFDQRVHAAYAARTGTELAALFRDLPGRQRPASDRGGRKSNRRDGERPELGQLDSARLDSARLDSARPGRARVGRRFAVLALLVIVAVSWIAETRLPPFFLFPLGFWLLFVRPRRRYYRWAGSYRRW
jgi:hypothetical protein